MSSTGLKLISTAPHGPHRHVIDVAVAMSDVPGAKSLRDQHLNVLVDDFVVFVPKQNGNLSIGKPDGARSIDHDHRIRSRIEGTAGELWRCRANGSDS
jgi:hypothetical protein